MTIGINPVNGISILLIVPLVAPSFLSFGLVSPFFAMNAESSMTLETWRLYAYLGWGTLIFVMLSYAFVERLHAQSIQDYRERFQKYRELMKKTLDNNEAIVEKHNKLVKQHNELCKHFNIILDTIEDGQDIKITSKANANKKRVLN